MLMRMIVSLLVVLFAAGGPAGAQALPSCQWPPYENDVRAWGEVADLFDVGGNVRFEMLTYNSGGAYVRVDCGDAANSIRLGCDKIRRGDSILLRGELADVLVIHCLWDAVANYIEPGVIYRCQGHTSGTCTPLTLCV